MYVSKPCILSWKWNINAQTYTLIFWQKSYFRRLLSVYVCLKSLCFIDQNCSNIHAQQLSCLNDDANYSCMYVSKPRVLSYDLRLVPNGTHPSSWLLEDPQKVIHIDTILILVYIHTCLSTISSNTIKKTLNNHVCMFEIPVFCHENETYIHA